MNKIWRDGPCSYQFRSQRHSFDKSDRFGRHSIYYKDDVNKQKLKENEIDNPELLIKKFRKEIEEASNERFKRKSSTRKQQIQEAKGTLIKQKELNALKLKAQAQEVPNLRDWYGNRATLVVAEQSISDEFMRKQRSQKSPNRFGRLSSNKSVKGGFTTARRMDLSRPLNFYPAPNAYTIARGLCTQRKGSLSMRSTMEHAERSVKQ